MAATIKVNNIVGTTGTTAPITLSGDTATLGSGVTHQGTFSGTFSGDPAQKTCKAWINLNGTGTVAIRDSFNVSSLTDHETGQIGVNFTTAMSNANYVVGVLNSSHMYDGTAACFDRTTTSFKCVSSNGSAYADAAEVDAIVFGD